MAVIRKGYAETRFGQVHYRTLGEGDSPPIVLFHMTAASSASYVTLMQAFAKLNVRTIAIDTPNYGESFRTDHEPTIGYIGEVVLAALDDLGVDRFHTFGHHTGASICLDLACRAPERVISASLNGLVSVLPEEQEAFFDWLVFANPVDSRGGHVMKAWTRILSLEASHMPFPAEIKNRDLVAMLHAGEDWAWGYKAVFREDTAGAMDRCTRPLFFLIGEHDGAKPWHVRELERHPQHPSHIAEGQGLFYAEVAPDDVARRLHDFMIASEAGRPYTP